MSTVKKRAWRLVAVAAAGLLVTGSPVVAQEEAKQAGQQGAVPRAWPANPEDDGSVSLANFLGFSDGDTRRLRARIGDGPHGSAGTGTGDYDWYVEDLSSGDRLVVDVDTDWSESGSSGSLDAYVRVYTWDGANPPVQVAGDDDDGRFADPYLVYTNTSGAGQVVYIQVGAFGSIQGDLFDSGSGSGATSEGRYDLVVGEFGANADEFPQFLLDTGSLWLTSRYADLMVTNTSTFAAARTLLTLENNGAPLMFYRDTSSGNPGWQESLFRNDSFGISKLGTGGAEFQVFPNGRVTMGPGPSRVFNLSPVGNLTIDGTLTQSSDRAAKIDVEPVDAGVILERLAGLELSTWSYRHTPGVRHLGPTAQDFAAVFGLGGSDTGIAAVDADGVALAAIQALAAQNQDLADENRQLQARIDALAARVERLEAGGAGIGKVAQE